MTGATQSDVQTDSGWKRCTRCGEWKLRNTDNFRKYKPSPDGLTYWCRPCLIAVQKSARERRLEHYREVNRQANWRRRGFSEDEVRERAARLQRPASLPMTAGYEWTLAEDDILIQYYGRGRTLSELANVLKRSRVSVRERARILGLHAKGKDWRDEAEFSVPACARAA